jgi:multimeric flavodoxin WrbA
MAPPEMSEPRKLLILVGSPRRAGNSTTLAQAVLLAADDLNHATELMSKHRGIRVAVFEIRPLDEEATASVNTTENYER